MEYYGIDLGTSQCLVARIIEGFDDGEFEVHCMPDENGDESFPSVVSFLSKSEYLIGYPASEKLIDSPDSTVELVKIRLGKTKNISVVIDGAETSKTPQEITSLLLKHMNDARNGKLSAPIVTVPAFFDQSQKDATMQSGELAGVNPKQLIEEPTAAIIYHVFSEYQRSASSVLFDELGSNTLVFDFGGGTLDLSLIHLTFESGVANPRVLAVGGDPDLGGNLIDFLFTKTAIAGLQRKYPKDLFLKEVSNAFGSYFSNYTENHVLSFKSDVRKEVKQFIFRLKRELERVKIILSSEEKAKIVFSGSYEPQDITRSQYEKAVLCCDELNIKSRIQLALEGIASYGFTVNNVLLVGGSSQIPLVKCVIQETFEDMGISSNNLIQSDDYLQAVAKGAAIQSALLDGVAVPPFKNNKCTSVVSRDIVLDCGSESCTLVKRGTPFPFSESKSVTIKIPHALSTNVKLLLSENISTPTGELVKKPICEYPYFLPLFYTGDELKLYLNIDDAGLYSVKAIHKPTKEEAIFEPQKIYSLTETELKEAAKRLKNIYER